MYEEGTERTVNGVRKTPKGCNPTCPFYCGLSHIVSRTIPVTTTEEEDSSGSQSLEAVKDKVRLHYDPRTFRAIERIESHSKKGIMQEWQDIENLINQPLRRK